MKLSISDKVIVILIFVVTTFGLSVGSSEEKSLARPNDKENGYLHKIALVGYVQDDSAFRFVNELFHQYFSDAYFSNSDRKVSKFVQVFIGSDVVKNERFVPPPNIEIPTEILDVLKNNTSLESECFVQRLKFIDGNNVVLLIHSAPLESRGHLKHCTLLAFATAVGGKHAETQFKSQSELENLIFRLTRELRT